MPVKLAAALVLAAGLLVEALAVAQPAGRTYRVGVLLAGGPSARGSAFHQGLRERGYVEGQNLVLSC